MIDGDANDVFFLPLQVSIVVLCCVVEGWRGAAGLLRCGPPGKWDEEGERKASRKRNTIFNHVAPLCIT